MKIAVRFFTRSGNTKRLAQAVAEAVGTEAKDITAALTEQTDILFLCCSYYAFDVDPAVKQFVAENKEHIGKIVCVGTSAMMKSMRKPVEKVVKPFGLVVADEEFHCRGEFKMFHKGRPDMADLARAALFAQNLIKQG
ncbi:MAG: flavodoxin [Oscillospiraceae bacterium]|nr:flavodoxin [Ruminococcus sp.]MBQ4346194.1 flavodoxin [Oscillospiraceae bacterium]